MDRPHSDGRTGTGGDSLRARVDAAKTLTLHRLLEARTPDGRWSTPLDVNGFNAAVYCIMLRTTGEIMRPGAAQREMRLLRHMITQVNRDGGFYKYLGSPSCRAITRVALLALRLTMGQVPSGHWPAAWLAPNDTLDAALFHAIVSAIERAEAFLRGRRHRTSLAFELDHRLLEMILVAYVHQHVSCPPVPVLDPEIGAAVETISSLRRLKRHVNTMTRNGLPAISILYRRLRSRNRFSRRLHGITGTVHALWRNQERAVHRLSMLIRASQNENGGWVYSTLFTMLNIMALCEAGATLDDPAVRGGMEYLTATMVSTPDDGGAFLTFLTTDIWDTAMGAYTYLNIAGHTAMSEEIRPALEFLLQWQDASGGFAVASASRNNPDHDSTGLVLLCLARALQTAEGPLRTAIARTLTKGCSFLRARQDTRGGFSAWESTFVRAKPGPLGFINQCLFDVATADVTARILLTLGRLGLTPADGHVRRALTFLLRAQNKNGAWWSRWGAGYIPGTACAAFALSEMGLRHGRSAPLVDPLLERAQAALHRAIGFLVTSQNADGGWGETVQADVNVTHAGRGSSTPTYAALTLTALLYAGYPAEDTVVRRGMEYLLATMTPDGRYPDGPATFTVFAGTFYYRAPLYERAIPLVAFNEFLRAC